jgi:hypothetical protein
MASKKKKMINDAKIVSNTQNIKYYLNDPSTPNLTEVVNFSPSTLFNVSGYAGPNENWTTPAGLASNVTGTLMFAMNNFYNKFSLNKIAFWSKVKTLLVRPNAGQMPNAYYDRKGLSFFWFNGRNGQKIFTALSAEVITHELGHAVLDFLRPDFWSVGAIEIWAFHEAFGDIFAFLASLHHDSMIDFMLNETKGNLYESSIVSKLAEQFGSGLGMTGYLRDVDNDLSYINPNTLADVSTNPNALTKEPHNFSRVMSGAIYRVFAEIYTAKGKNANSVKLARDFVRDTLFRCMKLVPASPGFFIAFTKVFCDIGKTLNPEFAEIAKRVFVSKNMMSSTIKANLCDNSDKIKLLEEKDDVFTMMKFEYQAKINDILHIEDEKYKNLKIRLPVDDLIYQNGDGQTNIIGSDINESIQCGQQAAKYIIQNDLLDKTWMVDENGLLRRMMIRCDGFVDNCTIPGQPEYGKCWKYRISGCGCGGPYGCPPIEEKNKPTIKNSCNQNYVIKCGNTRTSACAGSNISTSAN